MRGAVLNYRSSVKEKIIYSFSQPHQLFFFFGIVWAIVDMLVFALAYKGTISISVSPITFHAYSMIFIVFTQFFVGFIFTTFPRFCQSDTIARRNYVGIFALFQSGALLLLAGLLWLETISMAGAAVLFIANFFVIFQLLRIYRTGTTTHASSDPFWILTGFSAGAVSHILFALELFSPADIYTYAVQSGFWLYIIFTTFVIAQRMVPFFSHVMAQKQKGFSAIVFGSLIVKIFFALYGFVWYEVIVDTLLGLFILREIYRWKLPLFHSPAILWVLHLAILWLPSALLFGAFSQLIVQLNNSVMGALEVHLAAIGFLTTILIGFGTRVTLGHSGQTPHADSYTKNLFGLVQVVVIFRAIYAILGLDGDNMLFFDLSVTAWVILFILWSLRYAPVLLWGKKFSNN